MASAKDTKTAAGKALQSDVAANAISVDFDDAATQSDPTEQYCDYLVQTTESMFKDEDEIESADATVSYDEETEQYSIELLLKTNGEAGSPQTSNITLHYTGENGDKTLGQILKIMEDLKNEHNWNRTKLLSEQYTSE